ncbi:hypothetical protein [Raoultella planticola]|uniref:hypothetical protein n=1 Tax=Raoultella planticola TaxID=575 RepID=UPI00384FB93C
MQHPLFFISLQRPFDYHQKIFPTKQCWRIVAVLAGLFLLAISPYTRADQSSAAVAQSTAEGDAGNKPLRKLSPNQLYVTVEKSGDYIVGIYFDTGSPRKRRTKFTLEDVKVVDVVFNRAFKRIRSYLENELTGTIRIYDAHAGELLHEILVPKVDAYPDIEPLLENSGVGYDYLRKMDTGSYIIIPELYSSGADFSSYTLLFRRHYGK